MCWIECNGDPWKAGPSFDLACIGVNILLPSIVRVRNNVVKGKIFNVETLKRIIFRAIWLFK